MNTYRFEREIYKILFSSRNINETLDKNLHKLQNPNKWRYHKTLTPKP